MMEAQYSATLAERVAASLEKYAAMQLQADSLNAQYSFNAQSTAMSLAGQWYNTYLAGLQRAGSGSSAGRWSTRR